MGSLRFSKGHANGNDYLVHADPEGADPLGRERVRELCDRRFGAGARGVLRAVPCARVPDGAALGDERAEWFLDHRGADGEDASEWADAARVFVRFLLERGLARPDESGTVRIGTRSGVRAIGCADGSFTVDLGPWGVEGEALVRARSLAVARPALSLALEGPHAVVALADDLELGETDLTFVPRVDPEPAGGTDLEFVVPGDPLVVDGSGRLGLRVHERGVGEVPSSASGAAAAVAATLHWAQTSGPDRWRVRTPGGVLEVVADAGTGRAAVTGAARLVFDGRLRD